MKKTLLMLATVCACMFTAVQADGHEGPTMGWSSWNTYRINISDSLIMHQADELVRLGLDSLGYRFVNIDDGFFGGRDARTGKLKIHAVRFPGGLKPVVYHIHSLGLKAGIYSDAGSNTCGNFWDNDTIAKGVGLYGHELQDSRFYFSDLGFDFIKVDFCGGDPRQNTDSLELNPEKQYRIIRNAIDATGRDDVRMNVCRWDFPGTWAADIASSWRISHDISPSWQSVSDIINQNLYLSAYAGGGHFNDMDMLELGRGLSDDEERTHFGLWCIMSSPLMIGCDLSGLTESTLRLLKNKALIAVNQDPLGLQAYVAAHTGGCYVLVKDIEEPFGLTRAVAVYNPTDSAKVVSFAFADIDLKGPVAVTNLFDGQSNTARNDSLTVSVRPHGTELFRLKAGKRLIRRRYEAETAYLSSYQELINPLAAKTAFYDKDSRCSGGMKVVNAGYTEANDIRFRNVYVPDDMEAFLVVRYNSADENGFRLSVNGNEHGLHRLAATDGFAEAEIAKVKLRKGTNEIRLYSTGNLLPEIDYLELSGISAE